MARTVSAIVAWAAMGLVIGTMLTVLLARANAGSLGAGGLLELAVAMLVISLAVNGAFVVFLVLVWVPLARVVPELVRGRWLSYLVSGLIALNLDWILWNRLAMAHQWASSRPFMTWSGIGQCLLLAALALAILICGVRVCAGPRGRRDAVLALTVTVVLLTTLLAWNRAGETRSRTYSTESLRAAAAAPAAAASVRAVQQDPAVVLLALDGMCWSVMKPMMEAGMLPNLTHLASTGSAGYLDNFDESLSPSIWTSVYTGVRPRIHGIHDYKKLVLPRSGATLTYLLPMKPSMDTLYGFRYLLKYLEPLGLWDLEFVGTADRRSPSIWEVLTFFKRPVVVVNALASRPVQPVEGAMVALAHRPSPATLYPPELAEIWSPDIPEDQSGRTEASFQDIRRWLQEEVGFTLDLVHTFEPELVIYYSHFVDSVTHSNWDFYARGRFLLTDLPRSLDDQQWKTLLLDNADDRLVRSYVEMDLTVGRFLSAYPNSTYVVVSDHGWTFSGYEHFGSPEGVVILAGPGINSGGVLANATILDIVPTVLALLDAPISRELPGRVLTEALEKPAEPTYVTAYPEGVRIRPSAPSMENALDPEEIERLKALGYIE